MVQGMAVLQRVTTPLGWLSHTPTNSPASGVSLHSCNWLAGSCSPLLRPKSSLARAGKVPDSSHAAAAVCLLAPGGPRVGRQFQFGGAVPRHAHQSDRDLAGGDRAAGGGRRRPRRCTLRRLPGAAIRDAGPLAAAGDRPCALPAAGAQRPTRGLLRAGRLPRRSQQLQPRHPCAPVWGPGPGLPVHRAALQPAGGAAPAAPGRLRQLPGAERQPLEVPLGPRRLAQRPLLDRGPRRGGARRRGRPGPRRQPGQPGERQRRPPAGLLRGGPVRPGVLGAPGSGARRAQEAAAGERVPGRLNALRPARGRGAQGLPSPPPCPHAPPSSPRSSPCAPRPRSQLDFLPGLPEAPSTMAEVSPQIPSTLKCPNMYAETPPPSRRQPSPREPPTPSSENPLEVPSPHFPYTPSTLRVC